MGSQRVGHNLATKQQPVNNNNIINISSNKNACLALSMCQTLFWTLQILSYLNLTPTLWNTYSYYTHFTNGETEAPSAPAQLGVSPNSGFIVASVGKILSSVYLIWIPLYHRYVVISIRKNNHLVQNIRKSCSYLWSLLIHCTPGTD